MLYEFLKRSSPAIASPRWPRSSPTRAAGIQAAHRSAPLQRRDADRPEGDRRQEHGSADKSRSPTRSRRRTRRWRTACSKRSRSEWRRCARRRGRAAAGAEPAGALVPSRIAGTGGYLPAKRVTNADLAQIVETSDDWIVARTGIRARHIAATTRRLRPRARRRASGARRGGLAPAEVDLIVVATTRRHDLPSTACILQENWARAAVRRSTSSGVLGFVYALALADKMVATGMARNALVVGAEIYSRILDWHDRSTACSSATAPVRWCCFLGYAGHPVVAPARRRQPPPHPRSAGPRVARRDRGSPFLTMDGHACSSSPSRCWPTSRARRSRRTR